MKPSVITIHVKMNKKTFLRFGFFDTFILKKRLRSPALFAAILTAFSIVCFSMTDKSQSAMLGSLLLIIGLGVPLCYVLSFYLQLQDQAKRLGLKTPQSVYTLVLSDTGVRIMNDMRKEDEVALAWNQVYGAFCRRGAIYLYATPGRAFILPDGQASVSRGELWAYLVAHLPKGRAPERLSMKAK